MEKLVYCDAEKKETAHDVTVDKNGEVIFTCKTPNCGRFVKFPKGSTVTQIQKGLEKHRDHNDTGKVVLTAEDEKLTAKEEEAREKLLAALEKHL